MTRIGKPRAMAALVGLLALPAAASDGVREINQTCAQTGGCGTGDAAGFPVEITRAGSYRLTGNLDLTALAAPQDAIAIRIRSSDVTLDLNGFAILGATSCAGVPTVCSGVGTGTAVLVDTSDAVSNIVVRNGTVRGMGGNGITLENSAATGQGFEVVDVRVISNGARGIRTSASGSSTIRDCLIASNGTFGISSVGSGGGLITGNTVTQNGGNGINASSHLIMGNRVVGNALAGILGGPTSGIVSNVASGNSPDLVGGVQLGSNLCGTALCP